jgi:hypothetical protein
MQDKHIHVSYLIDLELSYILLDIGLIILQILSSQQNNK